MFREHCYKYERKTGTKKREIRGVRNVPRYRRVLIISCADWKRNEKTRNRKRKQKKKKNHNKVRQEYETNRLAV